MRSEEDGVKLRRLYRQSFIELSLRAAICRQRRRRVSTPTSFPSPRHQRPHPDLPGFSRDDVESAFMPLYLDKKIVKRNPFATVDPGVAKLVQMGVEVATRPTRTSSAASAAGDWWRPRVHPVYLTRPRPRLRVLLAVPRACRSSCGGAGRINSNGGLPEGRLASWR